MAQTNSRTGSGGGLRLAAGFLFVALLAVSLVSYHIYRMTSYEMVEKVGVAASHEMVDLQSLAEISYPQFVKIAAQNPDAKLTLPVLGIDLGIKAKELGNVPRDQFADFITRAIIKRIYYEGFSNVYDPSGSLAANSEDLQSITSVADAFVNKKFNDRALVFFAVTLALALIFSVPFFRMSPGFYKLTGFGGSLIIVGVPGILLALVQSRFSETFGASALTSQLFTGSLLPFIVTVKTTYLIVLLVGVGLFFAGASGIFITKRQATALRD